MGKQYFGTDGIRGRTNQGAMTAAIAMRVGQAAGTRFLRGDLNVDRMVVDRIGCIASRVGRFAIASSHRAKV